MKYRYAMMLFVAAMIAAGARAGISITYSSYPPIVAQIGMDRQYVAPGGQVHLWAADGNGGYAYDQDSKYINNVFAGFVNDTVHVTSWQVKDGNGASVGTLTTTSTTTATWTAPGSLPSYPATLTVTMTVDDGGSGWTNDNPVTRKATITVSPVTAVSYLSARPLTSSSIRLDWQAPDSGATGYKVFRRIDPNTPYNLTTPIAQVSTLTWTDNSVTQGTTYYYEIQAYSGSTVSATSTEVCATAEADRPTVMAYVTNSEVDNVLVIDTATDKAYATIAVGKTFVSPGTIGPLGITVSPDGAHVYVTNYKQETVSIIETATNREIDTDANPTTTNPTDSPAGINRIVLPPRQTGYPVRPDGIVVLPYDPSVPDSETSLVADFGGRIGTGSDNPGAVGATMVNVKTGAYGAAIPNPITSGITHPRRMAVTPDGTEVFFPDGGASTDKDNQVAVVNVTTRSSPFVENNPVIITAASMPNGRAPRPQGITITTTIHGTYAYVVNSMGDSVSIIDTATKTIVDSPIAINLVPTNPASTAAFPQEATASPDGAYVFVTGSQSGSDGHFRSAVWVIDTSTNSVVQSVALTDATQTPTYLYGAGRVAVVQSEIEGGTRYKAYVSNYGEFAPDGTPVPGKRLSVLRLDSNGLTQQPTIHTGDGSGPTSIALRRYSPVVPANLQAYATGSDSISLFWQGVPGAKGYNVYRGDAPTPALKTQIASNVTSLTVANGDTFTYHDSGLSTNHEYFYVVTAQMATAESQQSVEVSDTPADGAVPWHTRDVSSITGAFRSAFSSLTPDGELGSIRIVGPDGWIYEDGYTDPQPPDGIVLPDGSQALMQDGTLMTLPDDTGDVLPLTGPQPMLALLRPHKGPYRRVRTKPNYQGTVGMFYLPPGGSMHINPDDPNATPLHYSDVAYMYLGMSKPPRRPYNPSDNGEIEIDGGLQWSPATGSWAATMLIQGREVTNDPNSPNAIRPLINLPQNEPRFAPDQTVGISYFSYTPLSQGGGPLQKMSLVMIDGRLYGSDTDIRSLGGPSPFPNGPVPVRIKRAHSIAQMHLGITRTGSYLSGEGWSQGQLVAPGGETVVPWSASTTDEDGAYPAPGQGAYVSTFETSPYIQEDGLSITIQSR